MQSFTSDPASTATCSCANVQGLCCKACIAVNTADRLRCYKRSPQAQQQCTTVSYTEWASDVSVEIVFAPATSKTPIKNTRTRARAIRTLKHAAWRHACPHGTHIHRHRPGKYPNWDAQQREELVGPPANLMHGDHFQNRTKWWAISRWQSGSPQGPRGEMACNCVRVPPA